MNLEDMKLFLLQLEACRNLLAGVANPKAAVASSGLAHPDPGSRIVVAGAMVMAIRNPTANTRPRVCGFVTSVGQW